MFLPLLLLTLQSHLIHSKSIINTLPGFPDLLPFLLETGYVGIGEKEETQFFYYFFESERNPDEDPLIFHLNGGPGTSGVYSCFHQIGPLNFGDGLGDTALILNPNSWTKRANIIFIDMPAGTGFAYATTKEGWISSDSIMANQAIEFLRKFLIDHVKFLKNPLYIAGLSYMGIVIPVITLELYNANERGHQPALNIQGYIIFSPLTDKFMDFNSRLEYAHRLSLISDDIYRSAVENCHGDYWNIDRANALCLKSLQRYKDCTQGLEIRNILDPLCDENDMKPYCPEYYNYFIVDWANKRDVQQALGVRKVSLLTLNFIYIEIGENCELLPPFQIFVH